MAIDAEQTSSYLQYLPAFFQEDAFLGRFLLAFEQVLTGLVGAETEPQQGLEEIIADIAKLFDPEQTRQEFLPWLASWVALSLRADWSSEQQRKFLGQIVSLYRYRGTKHNLLKLLQIYTDLAEQRIAIREATATICQIGVHSTVGIDTQLGGNRPHYFSVTVNLPDANLAQIERQRRIITDLVDLEKPAHTLYDLRIMYDSMQINERCTIGVDTLLGALPPEATTKGDA